MAIRLADIGNLNPPCGGNLGGLHYLRIIPAENVIAIPAARNHIIPLELQLADGTNYLDIFFAQDQGEYKESMQETEHGEFYKQEIKVWMPKDTPDVAYWISRLTGIRCLAIYQDSNQFVKVVGSKESPLTFSSELLTGEGASSKNGHTLGFSGLSLEKAYNYLHFEKPEPGSRKRFSMGFNFGFRRH
jgi:hypothetical protein